MLLLMTACTTEVGEEVAVALEEAADIPAENTLYESTNTKRRRGGGDLTAAAAAAAANLVDNGR